MKAQAAAIGLLVAALVGCGSKPLTNERLASDLTKQAGIQSTLVCWKAVGKLGGMSGMAYDHVCGLAPDRPSLYVRTGVKQKLGWCLVTPRLNKAPDCPL
jgi:hypothetical protein